MITLALAVGVRGLVRQGAVVKRLSAVETLGSTDVICTDKTGTLTENRMRVTAIWTAGRGHSSSRAATAGVHGEPDGDALARSRQAMAACNNAHRATAASWSATRPRLAMLARGRRARRRRDARHARPRRRAQFHFDPVLKLMSTVDERRRRLWVDAKGAPEALLPLCSTIVWRRRSRAAAWRPERAEVERAGRRLRRAGPARAGRRQRALDAGTPLPNAARRRSATSACSGWWRCSIRRGPRSPTPSPAATRRASGSSWSPATTA